MLLTISVVGVLASAGVRGEGTPRGREFWIALAAADFAVPTGETAFGLLVEMDALLGSSDPFLRDEVAYTAAARWILEDRLLSADELRSRLRAWSGNLALDTAAVHADPALLRSFSALHLALLAALDNVEPFLSAEEVQSLLDTALSFLATERDRRGYDVEKGWVHATAHVADLLKFLARSPRLAVADQRRILDAVAAKCASFGDAFGWGEDERLGEVVRSIVRRGDFDLESFTEWLAAFPEQHAALWAGGPAVDPVRYRAVQNVEAVLRSASTALQIDAAAAAAAARQQQVAAASAAADAESGALDEARRRLLAALSRMR